MYNGKYGIAPGRLLTVEGRLDTSSFPCRRTYTTIRSFAFCQQSPLAAFEKLFQGERVLICWKTYITDKKEQHSSFCRNRPCPLVQGNDHGPHPVEDGQTSRRRILRFGPQGLGGDPNLLLPVRELPWRCSNDLQSVEKRSNVKGRKKRKRRNDQQEQLVPRAYQSPPTIETCATAIPFFFLHSSSFSLSLSPPPSPPRVSKAHITCRSRGLPRQSLDNYSHARQRNSSAPLPRTVPTRLFFNLFLIFWGPSVSSSVLSLSLFLSLFLWLLSNNLIHRRHGSR